MKSFAFVLAFIALTVFAQHTCDRYNCTTSLEDGQCARIDQIDQPKPYIVFQLQTCKDSKQICDLRFGAEPDYCRTVRTSPTKFPGEFCLNDTDCFSGKCNATCQGLSEGAECSDDSQCNTKLFCNSTRQCAPVKKENDDCSSSVKCDSYLVCNNLKCTKIGSLEDNSKATAPAACKSFFILNGTCTAGPTLVRPEEEPTEGPIVCPGKCTYKLADNKEFTEPCVCGRTADGIPLCNPGKGDISTDDVILFSLEPRRKNK